MKDTQGSPVQGRTKWWRFAAVLVPAAAAVGGLLFGVAAGAFPAQITVSGQEFKVSATQLRGDGFVQIPGYDTTADGTNLPVARSVIDRAGLDNLCQSVAVPDNVVGPLFPGIEEVVLRIEAGGGDKPAIAENLVIGLSELGGDAVFTNIEIGNDAGAISGEDLLTGQFGQRADRIVINELRQTAYSTTAGTFRLNGLHLEVVLDPAEGEGECFEDVAPASS